MFHAFSRAPGDPADPAMMKQYLDYMVQSSPRSSVHMQMPLMDSYSYQKVGIVAASHTKLHPLVVNGNVCVCVCVL